MKQKLLTLVLTFGTLALVPEFALAQNTGQVDFLIAKIFEYARMAVTFLMIIATLWFIWTVFQFIKTDDAKARAEKRKQMVSGIIGLFVIVSVWGIVYFIGRTLGVNAGAGQNYYGLPCPPGTRAIGPAGSCI